VLAGPVVKCAPFRHAVSDQGRCSVVETLRVKINHLCRPTRVTCERNVRNFRSVRFAGSLLSDYGDTPYLREGNDERVCLGTLG
jgi:hypothetical protein